jgi:hypothetical protein
MTWTKCVLSGFQPCAPVAKRTTALSLQSKQFHLRAKLRRLQNQFNVLFRQPSVGKRWEQQMEAASLLDLVKQPVKKKPVKRKRQTLLSMLKMKHPTNPTKELTVEERNRKLLVCAQQNFLQSEELRELVQLHCIRF